MIIATKFRKISRKRFGEKLAEEGKRPRSEEHLDSSSTGVSPFCFLSTGPGSEIKAAIFNVVSRLLNIIIYSRTHKKILE